MYDVWFCLGVDYTSVMDMFSLDLRFSVASVFDIIFEFSTQKITLKKHATVKRTFKLPKNYPKC
jgi:hypothetical protein